MINATLKGLDYNKSVPVDEIGRITGMEPGLTLLAGAEELVHDYLKMGVNLSYFERKKSVLGVRGKEFVSQDGSSGYVFLGRLHGSIKKGGDYKTLVNRIIEAYVSQGKEIVATGENVEDESAGFAWRQM